MKWRIIVDNLVQAKPLELTLLPDTEDDEKFLRFLADSGRFGGRALVTKHDGSTMEIIFHGEPGGNA